MGANSAVYIEMRFLSGGVSLKTAEMSDISAHYLNYKALKKQIKNAQQPIQSDSSNVTQSPDLTGIACPEYP